MNRNCISNNAKINSSIYETNSFLIKNQIESEDNNGVSLIEYAAFFGSIQIIKYLQLQGVELTSSLWIYAIHSQNAELIHFVEDCHVEPKSTVYKNKKYVVEISYNGCLNESIKCNHNAIADYFLNNYQQNSDEISNDNFIHCLKYYNFAYMHEEDVNESSFCQICKYDHYLFAYNFLINRDINTIIIQNCIKYNSTSYLSIIFEIILFNEIQNQIFQ